MRRCVEPERNALEVITTDSLVEGVHFDQAFVGAADIGHKALAVNLSDLAAMGAAPRVALLSLVLPPAWPVAHVDALLDGMTGAGRARPHFHRRRQHRPLPRAAHRRRHRHRIGSSPSCAHARGRARGRRSLRHRHAGRAPRLGLRDAARRSLRDRCAGGSMRYRRPEPRTRFGMMLGRNRAARACIDLSDGLADGVRQIGEASGLGAIIDADALPIEEGATLQRCPRAEAKITSSCLRYRPECARG